MARETSRADRVLVWLVLAGLVLGGLATTAVAFTAEGVLSRYSAADEHPDHDAAMPMDAAPTADHAGMTMPMDATPTMDHSHMPMPMATSTP